MSDRRQHVPPLEEGSFYSFFQALMKSFNPSIQPSQSFHKTLHFQYKPNYPHSPLLSQSIPTAFPPYHHTIITEIPPNISHQIRLALHPLRLITDSSKHLCARAGPSSTTTVEWQLQQWLNEHRPQSSNGHVRTNIRQYGPEYHFPVGRGDGRLVEVVLYPAISRGPSGVLLGFSRGLFQTYAPYITIYTVNNTKCT